MKLQQLDLMKENLNDTENTTGRRSKGEVCSEKKILNQCEHSYVIWIGHVWVNVSKTIMVIFT